MRLTRKTKIGYEDINECCITVCSDKLGQLEDIEDELGIDLITLFKARKTVFIKTALSGIREGHLIKIDFANRAIDIAVGLDYYSLVEIANYGKTWALTKGELVK